MPTRYYASNYNRTAERTYNASFLGAINVSPQQYFLGGYETTYLGNYSKTFTGQYSQTFGGYYESQYTGYFDKTYIGVYTKQYAGSYGGTYTGLFAGSRTYTAQYTGQFDGQYDQQYTGQYTGDFEGNQYYNGSSVGNFEGTYDGTWNKQYEGFFDTQYTSPEYTGIWEFQYEGSFDKNYLKTWEGQYEGEYAGQYTGYFSRQWSRTYVGQYQRTWTGPFRTYRQQQFTGVWTGYFSSEINYTKNYYSTAQFAKTEVWTGYYTGYFDGTADYASPATNYTGTSQGPTYIGWICLQPGPGGACAEPDLAPYAAQYAGTYNSGGVWSGLEYYQNQYNQIIYGSQYYYFFPPIYLNWSGGPAYTRTYAGTYIGNYTGVYNRTQSFSSTVNYARWVVTRTTNYTGVWTAYYISPWFQASWNEVGGQYTGYYDNANYETQYLGQYSGSRVKMITHGFDENYTKTYVGQYTKEYTGVWTSQFTKTYVGQYTKEYSGSWTGQYEGGPYLTTYSGVYEGQYTKTYAGVYEGQYEGTRTYEAQYEGNYAGAYERLRSVNYTGAYTKTYVGQYTKAYLGGYVGTFEGTFGNEYIGYYTKVYGGAYLGSRNTYTSWAEYTSGYSGTDTFIRSYEGTSDYVGLNTGELTTSVVSRVKDAGTWKQIDKIKVKDAGAWKDVKYAFIRENGAWKPTFIDYERTDITLQSNTSNFSLYSYLTGNGKSPNSKLQHVNIVIKNCYMGATTGSTALDLSTGFAQLAVGSTTFPHLVKVTVVDTTGNGAGILGSSGLPGSLNSATRTGSAGSNGGDAIKTSSAIKLYIDNQAIISGGGGGGGSGGYPVAGSTANQAGGSGGYGAGSSGTTIYLENNVIRNGAAAPVQFSVAGGNGGKFGQVGTGAGMSEGTRKTQYAQSGHGGLPGAAIRGYNPSYVTFLNTGIIYGDSKYKYQ